MMVFASVVQNISVPFWEYQQNVFDDTFDNGTNKQDSVCSDLR